MCAYLSGRDDAADLDEMRSGHGLRLAARSSVQREHLGHADFEAALVKQLAFQNDLHIHTSHTHKHANKNCNLLQCLYVCVCVCVCELMLLTSCRLTGDIR